MEDKLSISLTILGFVLPMTSIFFEENWSFGQITGTGVRLLISFWHWVWNLSCGKTLITEMKCRIVWEQKRNEGRQMACIVVWGDCDDQTESKTYTVQCVCVCVCVCAYSHGKCLDFWNTHTCKLSTSTVYRTL